MIVLALVTKGIFKTKEGCHDSGRPMECVCPPLQTSPHCQKALNCA